MIAVTGDSARARPVGRDVFLLGVAGRRRLAADPGQEAVADAVRDLAATRGQALVGPVGGPAERFVGDLRLDGMADQPGDHPGVGEVADPADGRDGGAVPGHPLGDLALDLQLQDHAPALLGREQAEVEIRVVGRRITELGPGVVAPLLQPRGPLVRPAQRGFAKPFGDIVAHTGLMQ